MIIKKFLYGKEENEIQYAQFPPTVASRIPADLHHPTGKMSLEE